MNRDAYGVSLLDERIHRKYVFIHVYVCVCEVDVICEVLFNNAHTKHIHAIFVIKHTLSEPYTQTSTENVN